MDVRGFPQRSDFDLVGVDNFAAGFMFTASAQSGCERIRFVARPLSAPTVIARITGVLEALTQHLWSRRPIGCVWGIRRT